MGEEFEDPNTDFEHYGGDLADYPQELIDTGLVDTYGEYGLEEREYDPDERMVVGMGGLRYLTRESVPVLGVNRLETGNIGGCLGMAFWGEDTVLLGHLYVPADEVTGGENDIGTMTEDVVETIEDRVGRPFEECVLTTSVQFHGRAAAERAQEVASEYVDGLVPVYDADDSTLGVGLDEGIYAPPPDVEIEGAVAPRGQERLDAPGGRILEDETVRVAAELGVDVPTIGDITREGRSVGDLVGNLDPGVEPVGSDDEREVW